MCIINENIYLAGGISNSISVDPQPLRDFYKFDTENLNWYGLKVSGDLPSNFYNHIMIKILENKILIIWDGQEEVKFTVWDLEKMKCNKTNIKSQIKKPVFYAFCEGEKLHMIGKLKDKNQLIIETIPFNAIIEQII